MKRLIAPAAALVLIAFGGVRTATATGTLSCGTYHQSYPGTRCVVASGSSAGYGLGRLSNTGDAAIRLECPMSFNPSLSYVTTKVWVVDQHPSDAVTCNARSVSATSGGVAGILVRTSSQGASDVPQGLTFPSFRVINQSSSYITMDCRIPQTSNGLVSSIVAYRLDETC